MNGWWKSLSSLSLLLHLNGYCIVSELRMQSSRMELGFGLFFMGKKNVGLWTFPFENHLTVHIN